MGRLWLWIAGGAIAVLALGGVLYVVVRDDEGNTSETIVQTGDSADPGATKTACDVFTPDIAKQVLGEGATQAPTPPGGNVSSGDIRVTQCLYNTGDSLDSPMANVLVRGAKNRDAYKTNEFGFDNGRGEALSGLGDDAYFSPEFGQVNILVNGGQYWVIVDADGNRDSAESIARSIVSNF